MYSLDGLTEKHMNELREIDILKDSRIEINDGWFESIKILSNEISKYISVNDIKSFKVNQIKTKFGTLRYYTFIVNEDEKKYQTTLNNLIRRYSKEISTSCEFCGNGNSLTYKSGVGVYTACEKHIMDDSKLLD